MIQEEHRSGIRAAVVAIFVFYLVVLLLNGTALDRQARLMPYGPMRSVCLRLIRPVAVLSACGPDRMRYYVEQIMEQQRERMQ